LQQFSTPSKFPGFDRSGSQTPQQQQNQEDYAMLFATLISRCAKDIDTLIESLPSEESSAELQVQSLRRLEAENKEAAEQLEEVTLKLHL
jgi:mediator of RNA polymerase II transcription subunit 21